MDVQSEVWVRVAGEQAWSAGRIIEITSKDVRVQLVGDGGAVVSVSAERVDVAGSQAMAAATRAPAAGIGKAAGVSTSKLVATTAPAPSAGAGDLLHVKLRNTDYSGFATGTRGGVDDLIQLTHLHEPAILDVLHLRYTNDCICECNSDLAAPLLRLCVSLIAHTGTSICL